MLKFEGGGQRRHELGKTSWFANNTVKTQSRQLMNHPHNTFRSDHYLFRFEYFQTWPCLRSRSRNLGFTEVSTLKHQFLYHLHIQDHDLIDYISVVIGVGLQDR